MKTENLNENTNVQNLYNDLHSMIVLLDNYFDTMDCENITVISPAIKLTRKLSNNLYSALFPEEV